MSVFRKYDLRGVYPTQLNEEIIYNLGRAFGTLYSGNIVVGGDSRLSTPSLKESFIKGLNDSGANVVDIGLVSSPMVYFSCYKLGYDGGAMITASHNPKEYNGIKFCNSKGLPVGYEEGMKKVKELLKTKDFREGKGSLTKKDIYFEYFTFMRDLIKKDFSGFKIVVDGANGSSGKIHSNIIKNLGAEVVELYCRPDGNFPNHSPNPMVKEFIVDLQKKVLEEKADLGLAFDGDGDRLAIVNEKGEAVDANHTFSLMIEDVLNNNNGGKIVQDILSSKLISDITLENKGIPVIWMVGHTLIASKCVEENALMAGEVSGHYFFKESNHTDDVLIAALKILGIMKRENKKFSELTKKYPYYYSYLDRIKIKDGKKSEFIEDLKIKLKEKGHDLITLDGIRVNFDNGWMLFRPSHTEQVISMGCESSDKKEFEDIKKVVDDIIKTIPSD